VTPFGTLTCPLASGGKAHWSCAVTVEHDCPSRIITRASIGPRQRTPSRTIDEPIDVVMLHSVKVRSMGVRDVEGVRKMYVSERAITRSAEAHGALGVLQLVHMRYTKR
jgi:hypothetical protein